MTPALEALYAEPRRRYHTRRHIDDCLEKLAAWASLSEAERRILIWAIWWHDAVYDPSGSDNEAKSAEMARRDLPALGASPAEVESVARLIMLTAGHQVEPGDRLAEVLVSIDLSILAAAEADYDNYARQVRQEYAHVPDEFWRPGRAAVLRKFLDAPMIFPDADFRARHEATARANLAREIAALS